MKMIKLLFGAKLWEISISIIIIGFIRLVQGIFRLRFERLVDIDEFLVLNEIFDKNLLLTILQKRLCSITEIDFALSLLAVDYQLFRKLVYDLYIPYFRINDLAICFFDLVSLFDEVDWVLKEVFDKITKLDVFVLHSCEIINDIIKSIDAPVLFVGYWLIQELRNKI